MIFLRCLSGPRREGGFTRRTSPRCGGRRRTQDRLRVPISKTLISNRRNAIVLVYENAGVVRDFIIAILIEAPPVYAPGGKTCLIDDFAVTESDWDKAGRALMDEAHEVARAAGAIQAVVVCGHLDEAKRAFLDSQGLSIASEWFVKNL
jgi:GNAT superfamily N-acetyltransferase